MRGGQCRIIGNCVNFGPPLIPAIVSPFVYCGPVEFLEWKGDMPITVKWQLREQVPARLRADFRVPGERD